MSGRPSRAFLMGELITRLLIQSLLVVTLVLAAFVLGLHVGAHDAGVICS